MAQKRRRRRDMSWIVRHDHSLPRSNTLDDSYRSSAEAIRQMVREGIAEEMAKMEDTKIVKKAKVGASTLPKNLYSRKLRIRR